jgi:hypothetical protein
VVYWPFYLVFAGYVVARLAGKETNVTWWAVGGVFAVLALALVPVFFDALALRADVRVHVFSFLPSPRAFADLAACCASRRGRQ